MTDKKRMAPPLAPGELIPQMVSEADLFTALRYCRSREETPAIWELEKVGAKVLPGVAAALGDTYNCLWSDEPHVKASDQVKPSQQYWRGMLEGVANTAAFQELHAKTYGDRMLSMVGTVEAGRTMLGLVSADDADKLEEVSEAQAEADDLEKKAQQQQADAEAMQALADQMQGAQSQGQGDGQDDSGDGEQSQDAQPSSGQPQSGGGKPQGKPSAGGSRLTPEQARELANRLADAQAKAAGTRAEADQAKVRAQELAETLMGQPGSAEAEAKTRELTRAGLAALTQASKKVSELSETIEAWGLERGELQQMEVPEAMGLLQKMRSTTAFQSFAKLLGRLRAIARKKAKSKVDGEGRRVARTEYGRDITRAHTSELVAIAHPATKYQGFMRWAHSELRLRGTETMKKLGEGPVVVCEDASGSMDGPTHQWRQAVTLALAHYAKLRKRSYGWVMFDAYVQRAETYLQGRQSAKQLLDIAEARSGGGTNFERPLKKAVEMIEHEGLKKADIVLVTDGECAVSDEFLQEFRGAKQRLEFSVITVICDAGESISDATVKLFSDRVERASSFTAEEAERKVFGCLQ